MGDCRGWLWLPKAAVLACLALTGASSAQDLPDDQPPEHCGLQNVIKLTDDLINGSPPEGDYGFDSLKTLGVKTIISVDGAFPDAARAEARGMRYVHLPIGYDGIENDEGLKLLKAIRDLPKPIYIHCFHGIHRSPAAAAYVLVGLGQVSSVNYSSP